MIARAHELGSEIRRHLRRRYPEVPADVPLSFRSATSPSRHMLIVETAGKPIRRLFLKGPLRVDVPGESITMERAILAEVGPRLRKDSPATRCPELVAYYPEEQFLLLEMVEGDTLDSRLFGLGVQRAPGNLAHLLRLSGQWLRRFHRLTESHEEGNPFAWFQAQLREPSVQAVIEKCGGRELADEIGDLASRIHENHATYRKRLCMVHGNFILSHVLIQEDCIYVIDLAGSHEGYPYEDLACFLTFYDVRLPWRRLIGAVRMPREEQRRHFLAGYHGRPLEITGPDALIMRLARLLAMARFVQFLGGPDYAVSGVASWVSWPWFRHRFQVVCDQEMEALRLEARRPAESGSA